MQIIHRLDGDAEFRRSEIPDGGLALRRDASGVARLVRARRAHAEDVARIVPFVENEARHAALIVAPGVRDLTLGGLRPVDVRVLVERDEIVFGENRAYFTSRAPLEVSRQEEDASCGVCGDGVRGCEVIHCTHCAAVSHAGALLDGGARDCFAHRGSCPGCGLRKQDFEWMPESGTDGVDDD
jgi:hypothetical protein